jgi:hypothetical protein
MRSVKVKISGAYWDSQIYSGELILFDCDGALHRINWREIIDELAAKNIPVQTALRVAYSDSDLFYNPKVRKILLDPAISTPIKNQLAELALLDIPEIQKSAHWRVEDSPFDFLSADTDIYYGQIFACGDEGLFSFPRQNLSAGRFSKNKAEKYHEASFLSIKASDRHTALAAAAGDDGLFEFPYKKADHRFLDQEKQLTKRPCNACDWSFQSVMGWTPDTAFLASFREEKDSRTNKSVRSFDRIVEPREMFGDVDGNSFGFTWGSREKIYRISSRGIEVANYSPAKMTGKKSSSPQYNQKFSFVKSEEIDGHLSNVAPIATATAPFGTILEFDDHIVVLRSDGEIEKFVGEAVHWRVFGRSENYSNQLHIVYDDHILITSFVHDYFVNQSEKLYGFSRATGSKVEFEFDF